MTHSYDALIAMLEDESKLIDWSAEINRIKNVGSRAIAFSSMYQTQTTSRASIVIRDGVGELPIDCLRFEGAEDLHGNEIQVRVEGDMVKPRQKASGEIVVVYKALPTDEDGYPLIHNVQLNYVFWTVFKTFMRDFRIDGKIDANFWQEIKDNQAIALRDAKKPRLTKQDWDRGLWLLKNGRYFMINPNRF